PTVRWWPTAVPGPATPPKNRRAYRSACRPSEHDRGVPPRATGRPDLYVVVQIGVSAGLLGQLKELPFRSQRLLRLADALRVAGRLRAGQPRLRLGDLLPHLGEQRVVRRRGPAPGHVHRAAYLVLHR